MAFLLPGMILLYGIGLWYPSLFPALQAADKADASIGPSIIYLLVCVAAGLIISAVRWVFYEKGVCRKKQFNPDHFNRLSQSNKLSSFKAVVDEHYRYHQFYGRASIALLPSFAYLFRWTYATQSCFRVTSLAILILLAEVLLGYTASGAWCRYIDRGNHIVCGIPKEEVDV